MAEAKKNLLTRAGLNKLEKELQDLKVNRRQEIAEKIKEAREQGDFPTAPSRPIQESCMVIGRAFPFLRVSRF